MSAPSAPRIPPLTEAELSDEQRELVGGISLAGQAGNIFGTLVRHPGLFRKWMPFGGKLLAGKLPPRDRELLILRTAWNCGAEYEFGQHVLIAMGAGLTREEVDRVPLGPDDNGWSAEDALLLKAADELHAASKLTDETWAALQARYDERQIMEVPFLVGHYHMVGFVLNSFGVQREDGVPGFPAAGSS
jgi:alkylhydroperoxidase family enzyme